MPAEPSAVSWTEGPDRRHRLARLAVVLTGIILGQAILFGPSLTGRKILLPVDILAWGHYYLPDTPETREVVPTSLMLSDQVLVFEPGRRLAASEIRAGRVPLWNPHNYAGAPFAAFWTWSLPHLLYYACPSSFVLAWLQLLKSLIAGLGAYVFFRRVLDVGFVPAAVGAWCYPLTGFLILWQGFPLSNAVVWLPWVLAATHAAIGNPKGWGGPGLALAAGMAMLGGQAGPQVLLASGVFGAWCLIDLHRRTRDLRRVSAAAGVAVCGGLLGILISMPQILPLLEYTPTGARMIERGAGKEERPPVGLSALPQIVLPEIYGSARQGSYRVVKGNRLESSAAAYTGLLATLVLAPLAFRSRRHRSVNSLWLILGALAAAWVLNLPGLVSFLRLPGLNLLEHNRFVFATSFAILALAVVGLEVLRRREAGRRWWFGLPAATLIGLGIWCVYRSIHLPEPVASGLEAALHSGRPVRRAATLDAIAGIQQEFTRSYIVGALLCAVGIALWLLILRLPKKERALGYGISALIVVELLWFGHGVNPQCDPRLDYPEIELLTELRARATGRVLGMMCLPPNVNLRYGLDDIRGYDGADPARLIELLEVARDKRYGRFSYALTQKYVPHFEFVPPRFVRVPPVLDLLAVQYLVFRSPLPDGIEPLLAEADYWVVENPNALPRAYVPRRVRTVVDKNERLRLLAEDDFDPREIAYVESPVSVSDDCRGAAGIVSEVPREVMVSAELQTDGLLVLADQWYEGWRAFLDDEEVPVVRVNHALRGIELPAGRSDVVFRYEPAGFAWGVRLMILATLGLLLWAGVVFRSARYRASSPDRTG